MKDYLAITTCVYQRVLHTPTSEYVRIQPTISNSASDIYNNPVFQLLLTLLSCKQLNTRDVNSD